MVLFRGHFGSSESFCRCACAITFSVQQFCSTRSFVGILASRRHGPRRVLALRLLSLLPAGSCPPKLLPGLRKAESSLHHHGSAVHAGARQHLASFAMGKKGQRQGNQMQRQAGTKAARSSDDWCCKLRHGPDGQPYRNFGDRRSCNRCQVAKGSCFLCKAGQVLGKAPASNLAERQVSLRQLDYAKRLQVKDAQIARLKQEVSAARQPLSEVEDAADADALQQEIDRLSLFCQACNKHDPDSAHTKEVAAALQEARKRKAASKPLHTQVLVVEKKLEGKRKTLELGRKTFQD